MMLVSCEDTPKTELCIVADDLTLACDDPRRDHRQYFRDIQSKDFVTNREDYFTLEKYVKDLQKRVKQCK